jgi:hypothetical protein
MRRKQLLDVLERTGSADYADLVAEMVRDLDFERGFFILQNCIGHLGILGEWDRIWSLFEKKHGSLAAPLVPTFREIIRRDALTSLRSSIGDVEHRFFLALLLNVGTREEILRMIRRKYRGTPLATITRWARELIQNSESGTWLLDAEFPEELGFDSDDQQEIFLESLRHFLNGGKTPSKLSRLGKAERLRIQEVLNNSSWEVLRAPQARTRRKSCSK